MNKWVQQIYQWTLLHQAPMAGCLEYGSEWSVRFKLLIERLPVKIGLVRANLISFNVNNGSPLKRHGPACGFAPVCPRACVSGTYQPVVSDHTRLNFTGVEKFDRKVRQGRPYSLDEIGKSFSADAGIRVGIAKRAVFCETGDKCIGIATVPGVVIVSCDIRSFHWVRFLGGEN